ncbi:MAG: DnaJ domain-containing protein [Lysobacterales bacterium]
MSTEALDLALAMFREPARIAELRERALPSELGQVIRLAAGEAAAVAAAVERCDESEDTLKEASVFFLQQVLFAPGADAYRTLGVEADAPQERLREHYRWLMKWLHPDRNQDGWEAVYADRVNAAWQDLKTLDRRAEYDRKAPTLASSMAVAPPPVRMRAAVPPASGPILSGSTVRRLPAIILGGLGLTAALVLGLMYWAQKSTERELAARMADGTGVAQTPPAELAAPTLPLAGTDAGAGSVAETGAAQTGDAAPAEVPPLSAPALEAASATVAPAAPDTAPAESAVLASTASAPVATTASPAVPHKESLPSPAAAVAPALAATAAEGGAPAAEPALAEPASLAGVQEPSVAPAAMSPTSAPEPAPVVAAPAVATHSTPPASRPQPVSAPPVAPAVRSEPVAVSAPAVPAVAASVAAKPAPEQPPALPAASTPTPLAMAATTPTASTPPPAPAPPTAEQSAALVADLQAAYASGNGSRFESLFVQGAVPAELMAIRARIDSTQMRYLEFADLRWDEQPGYRRASFYYRETYVLRGEKRGTTESGRMELHLALHDGRAQIARARRGGGS